MSEHEQGESRRKFLQKIAALLCCQSLLKPLSAGADESVSDKLPFKVSNWTGDDFTIGHKLRAGDLPTFPASPERTVDFVIIGGGIAGLTAAHKLKDKDILLLEQYDSIGGHARGGSYRGIDYSWGSAYTSTINGTTGELFSDLGIKPVELDTDRNSWYWQQKWYGGVKSSTTNELYGQFDRLMATAGPIFNKLQKEEDQEMSPAFAELDATPFASCFKDFSAEFTSIIDSFCRSSLCGGINQISALAGYSLLAKLVSPIHVFKGGNAAITRALMSSLSSSGTGRMLTNTFVWKVEIQNDGASVIYTTADGVCHRVQCRHAIIATSPMVAARQLSHIENQLRAQLLMFKFGSYLVANCLMKKKLFNESYDCFVGAPYTFADITVAETPYTATGSYTASMGSVLTVYQPYPAGSEGRALLMTGDRQQFARQLAGELEKLIEGFEKDLDEMVLTRWGHALAILGPGYYTRLKKIQPFQERFSLAHSSIAGGPTIEAALRGGTLSAQNALKIPPKVSMLVGL